MRSSGIGPSLTQLKEIGKIAGAVICRDGPPCATHQLPNWSESVKEHRARRPASSKTIWRYETGAATAPCFEVFVKMHCCDRRKARHLGR